MGDINIRAICVGVRGGFYAHNDLIRYAQG